MGTLALKCGTLVWFTKQYRVVQILTFYFVESVKSEFETCSCDEQDSFVAAVAIDVRSSECAYTPWFNGTVDFIVADTTTL